MRPKEYYEIHTVQEENNFVFVLLPSELEEQYKEHIKTPIEAIETPKGNVMCHSYLEFTSGAQVMDEIWKGIGKANIVIADITYFKPNVMLELGVALMTKDSVFIIADKDNNNNAQISLPYDLAHTKVDFYEKDKLELMTKNLVSFIRKRIKVIEKPLLENAQAAQHIQSALERLKDNDLGTALVLFQVADNEEPENWYIYKEWGKALLEKKDFSESNEKFRAAIEFTESDRQKALIYIDWAKMHRLNNEADEALVAYGKAENLDRNNPDLYENWAYLHYTIGNFAEANSKMLNAVRILDNKDNKLKSEYYHKRGIDKNFTISLAMWLRKNTTIDNKPNRKTYQKPIKDNHRSQGYKNKNYELEKFQEFEKKYRVGSVLTGSITGSKSGLGLFIQFENGATGMIHSSKLPSNFDMSDRFSLGKTIKVKVILYNYHKYQINLDLV